MVFYVLVGQLARLHVLQLWYNDIEFLLCCLFREMMEPESVEFENKFHENFILQYFIVT